MPEKGRKFSILSSKQDSDFKRTYSHLIPDDMQRSVSVTSDLLDFTAIDKLDLDEQENFPSEEND
jgi:hypothetical protein